jgi:hypothetical protein
VSRGPGVVQREVLERLDIPSPTKWTKLADLAGPHPTESRLGSVRRAVHKLEAAGKVETTHLPQGRVPVLAARLALDPEQWDPVRQRDSDAQLHALRARLAEQEIRKCYGLPWEGVK